ncbi:50S ribosomal protein L25/general stress protein Ctc [Crenobacter intestini]|uniref:Large ribosomal subunit protein bL25 n=1 Tax=Crenobacter intestini TaxID=2563443 RepID=A0A4T0ULW5_9NEIS|nr:50S ribosomal protein L25/general stress protein Ctc [Crenobacter intestini]TIC79557.1 50S ribosomal protein L25/general stress protein Ctc [Crenobacter intestini]
MAYELIAAKREEMGTGASRRLRHAGKVPAVVYGDNKDAVSLTLDHNTLFYALKEEAFHASVLDLVIDGAKEAVLLRDFQMHPYKAQVMHIDFQRVNPNQKVNVKVPLHFVGGDVCPAVKLQSGSVTHVATEVEVRSLPAALPSFVEADLSAMSAGSILHLSDLKLPEGVELVALARGENATVATATGIAAV